MTLRPRSALRAATGHLLADLWHDAHYALRTSIRALRKESGFTFTAILILTLAMALNVTAFRVMDATLFHGYPLVKQNERMVFIDERFPYPGCCVSYADFDAWRTQARSFQGLTFGVIERVTLSEGAGAVRDVDVHRVSPNAFRVLGVEPAMGRDFRSSEDAPGAASVLVVSHRFWTTRLGGRADVIGTVVRVNGAPATIVGVMPEGFDFPQRTDLWMPLEQTADLRRVVANGSFVFGRLADGVSEETARTEVEAINARLAAEFPATNRDVHPIVRNFMDSFAGPNASLIYGSLWAGAWLVLAIAFANVANLALARAQSRARETRTRMALGAGRGRIARQWFVEGLLLAAGAGFLAWWATAWSTRVWAAATETPYRLQDYTPDLATFVYLVAVTLGAAAAITLVPIARLWRVDVDGGMRGEARGATLSLRAKRLSSVLVAGQTMLAIVLMSGAGVLGHSLWNVLGADLGIETPENVLIGKLELPGAKYPTPESRVAFFDSLRARFADIPGATSAAIANGRPVDDHEPRPVEVEGQTRSPFGAPVFSSGPDYFRTIGASMLAGRDFSDADGAEGTPVAIVNRRFAETYFPGQNAVGQRIRLYAKRETAPGQWRTIVGVVSDVMQNDAFRREFHPAVYVPFAQEPATYGWFFVRARYVSAELAAAVREEARQADPDLEILNLGTLRSSVGFDLNAQRGGPGGAEYLALSRQAAVAPVFAAIALLLAATGLYAAVARSVGERTREIGVRMALGAAVPAIRRLVLFEGMMPVGAGLVLGLAASLAVNRVLQSQLVDVSPYDALTLVLAPSILIMVALVGCLFPLRQAERVDPVVALRHE